MKRTFFVAATLVAALHAGQNLAGKNQIGYYASWQLYDRAKLAAPANLDFSQWTRINFAFMQTALDGTLHGTDPEADPQVLFGAINWYDPDGSRSTEHTFSAMVKPYADGADLELNTAVPQATTNRYNNGTGLIDLAHKAGTEVYASIGGWSLSSNFPTVAANATKRTNFAHSAANLVRDWGLDGIDIDWEYPGYTDHHGTSADGANYLLLLRELRDSIGPVVTTFGRHPGITAALPCGPGNIAELDVKALSAALDQMNLMTYDFHGAFDPVTNHNSGLFWNGIGDSLFTVAGCADLWLAKGAPAAKLNIGTGFYGRSFAGATTLGASHRGNDAMHWSADEGMPSYYNIVAQSSNMQFHWDDKAQVPWANFVGGGMVTFEDTLSERLRAKWLIDKGLAGIIVWEMSGDVMADKSTPLASTLHSAFGGKTAPVAHREGKLAVEWKGDRIVGLRAGTPVLVELLNDRGRRGARLWSNDAPADGIRLRVPGHGVRSVRVTTSAGSSLLRLVVVAR